MVLDVIKTRNIGGKSITLVYFPSVRGYEVQISEVRGDTILDSEGMWTRKTDGIRAWKEIVSEHRKKLKKVI
jgi:predicted oxidoreductase